MLRVIETLHRIAEDKKEYTLLREEFNTFIMKKGMYAMVAVQADAATMDAIDETPNLKEVAKKVLSQPISSSSAELEYILFHT